jgi:hypothetical protein
MVTAPGSFCPPAARDAIMAIIRIVVRSQIFALTVLMKTSSWASAG